MLLDKQKVAGRFNKAVNTYDRYAVVQKRMAQQLLKTVTTRRPEAVDILEIGCGTGSLTQLLTKNYPRSRITAIDLADKMVDAARSRIGTRTGIRFLVADAEDPSWDSGLYDLVVSNATFQWFNRPEQTLRLLKERLKPGGLLVFTTFGPDTFRELHMVFEAVERDWGLESGYHGLPLRSSQDWEAMLSHAGLVETRREADRCRLEYENCHAFLRSVQKTGANQGSAKGSLVLERRLLSEVIRRYDETFRGQNGVFATWELQQFQGWRPVKKR